MELKKDAWTNHQSIFRTAFLGNSQSRFVIKKQRGDNLMSFSDRINKGEEADEIFPKFGEVDILFQQPLIEYLLPTGHSTKHFTRELSLKQITTTNP